jgi:hypothetical protein
VITRGKRRRAVDRRDFLLGAAGLALTRGGPRPTVLVTADLQEHVVAVDLASGRVVGRTRTLPYPRSIEAIGSRAVVAHSEIGAVSILDGRRVAHVLHDFAEPRYTAAHPDRRHAFVSDAKLGQVVTVDVERGRAVGRVEVGAHARHLSLHRGARALWVVLGSKALEVAVLDVSRPECPRLVRRFRPPFLGHDVGFAPDGRHVWVSSGDRFELALYEARSGRLLRRLSGDWPPQHVTFHRGLAYVTSGWSGTFRVHRADGRLLRRTVVPVGSYNVQQAFGRVLTPGLGTGRLATLDDTGRLLRTERVARSSHDCCVVAL